MNKRLYFMVGGAVSAGLMVLMIYGLFFASNPKTIPTALLNKPAKPFNVTTFAGENFSLEDFKNKPLILNFWASWCVACKAEAKIMEAAHKKYTPLGASFVGIAINDTREDSLAFIRKYGKTYTLGPDDIKGTISLDYGVTAVPETFLIDKQGIIRKKVIGSVSGYEIAQFLDQQLGINQ